MDDLRAADVPVEFLSEAGLVGWIPFRALQIDPRVSYCMYIPQKSLEARGNARQQPLPLLVNVHGTERRAERCCMSLAAFADQHRCAILAPLFPTCIGTRYDLDNYKTIRYGSMRFDLLLLAMIDEVKHVWGHGIFTDQVFMMGFSGGGQFVHRFLYLHPERLLGVSIGAPGRPTDFLDYTRPWPQGVANLSAVFDGKAIDLARVEQVKAVQLFIGADDIEVPGNGFFEWLTSRKSFSSGTEHPQAVSSSIIPPATVGRRETILKVQHELKMNGIDAQLVIVPGVAHEISGMLQPICQFWEPLLQEWHREQGATQV